MQSVTISRLGGGSSSAAKPERQQLAEEVEHPVLALVDQRPEPRQLDDRQVGHLGRVGQVVQQRAERPVDGQRAVAVGLHERGGNAVEELPRGGGYGVQQAVDGRRPVGVHVGQAHVGAACDLGQAGQRQPALVDRGGEDGHQLLALILRREA